MDAATGRAEVHHHCKPVMLNNSSDADNISNGTDRKQGDDAGLSSSSSVPSLTPLNITSTSPSTSSPNLQQQQQAPQDSKLQRKMSRRVSITPTPSAAEQTRNSAAHVLLDWLQGSFDNHRQLMSESDSGLLLDNCHPWVHINIKPIVMAQQNQRNNFMSMPPMSYIEYADNNPLHTTRTQLLIFSPLKNDVKTGHRGLKQPICMQMFDVENSQLEQLAKNLKQQQTNRKSALRYRAASLDFDCGTGNNTAIGNTEQTSEISALMANATQITTIVWHVYEKHDKFLGFIQHDETTSCIRRPNFGNPGIRSRSVNENPTADGHHGAELDDNETDDGFSDDAGNTNKKSSWMSSSSRVFPTQNKQQYGSINEAAGAVDEASVADDVMLNDIMAAKQDGLTPDLILSLNELLIANTHIISRFQPPSGTADGSSSFLSSSTTSADGLSHQHYLRPFLSDCLIPYFHFRRCSLYSGSIEMSEDKSALDTVSDADRLSLKQIILHDQGDRATLVGSKTGTKYQVELAVVPWLDRDGLRIAVYEADNDMPCAMTVTAESQYIQLSLSWLNIRFVYCDDYIEMFNNNSTIHDANEEAEAAVKPEEKDEPSLTRTCSGVNSQSTPVAPTTTAAAV